MDFGKPHQHDSTVPDVELVTEDESKFDQALKTDSTISEEHVESSELNDKAPENMKSATNGRFYGYAAVPTVFFTLAMYVLNLSIFASGHGWSRNPVAVVLGLMEPMKDTKKATRILNSHAFIATLVVVMVSFQVLSAVKFGMKQKAHTNLRKAHVWNGRVAFLIWTTVCILGGWYAFVSHYIKTAKTNDERAFFRMQALGSGVLSFVNMAVGVYVAASKAHKDLLLHKGCMMFALHWVNAQNFDQLIFAVTQAIASDCYLHEIFGHATGQFLQLLGFVVAAWYFDPLIFRSSMVRINLVLLALRLLTICLALQPVTAKERGNSGSCFYEPEYDMGATGFD